jgi:hypothetical protein
MYHWPLIINIIFNFMPTMLVVSVDKTFFVSIDAASAHPRLIKIIETISVFLMTS